MLTQGVGELLAREAGPSRGLSENPIRVLVVGPQLLAQALGGIMAADPDLLVVQIQAALYPDVDDVCRAQPDVLLLCSTADAGVAAAVSALRAAVPSLKTIILGPAADRVALPSYLDAGAAGYLTADCSASDLIESIKRVYAGAALFDPELLVDLITRPRQVAAPLAARELAVLQALASGASTDEVAAQLGITVHTVRTHLKNTMTKLNSHSKLEAIIIALKAGWITLPE